MAEQAPTDRFAQAKARFFDGLACYRAGDFAQAERHYLGSLSLVPGRASTLINLAAAQLRLARPEDALASADAALVADADSTDALLHRATALAQLARRPEALAAFDRLLALDPAHALAWSSRGSLLRELQRPDDAAHAFREALRHGAEADLNAYYLASVSPGEQPPAAPSAYVQRLFDDYADAFDAHLVGQLHYEAPRRLIDTLPKTTGVVFESALDLGCGTGLCGPLVRAAAKRLTGVDLSARMLAKARELEVYDRLEQADLVQFLNAAEERYDLILAADVFIYVGDLAPVFERVRRAIPAGGVFCFSIETLADGGADYLLLPSLRYAHAKAYLLRLAARHGFETAAMEAGPVRQEQRETIDGLYVCLRRVVAPGV